MSFSCENCNFNNTEVQSAGEIQENGVNYSLTIPSVDGLDRQVVISDTGIFRIEDLDVEIPTGRGKLTNIQGVLESVVADLRFSQTNFKQQKWEANSEIVSKLETIIDGLLGLLAGRNYPFTVSLNDPAGNSWIEQSLPGSETTLSRTSYQRTLQQNIALGLSEGKSIESEPLATEKHNSMEDVDIQDGQLYSLPTSCPGCLKPALVNMQMVKIPYFQQVILSAITCQECGFRSSDVKTGGEVPQKGTRILLHVKDARDLSRDVLKSETCMLKIPECNLEVIPGTMGGRFTTLEGLLTQIRDDLQRSIFDVDDENGSSSDSMPDEKRKAWCVFFEQLKEAIRGEIEYTVILEDPLGASYVQNLKAPEPDPQLTVEEYERSQDQEEELGLSDMRTQLDTNGQYVKPSDIEAKAK